MPTSNEREMLSSNEALKELTIILNNLPHTIESNTVQHVTLCRKLYCSPQKNNTVSYACLDKGQKMSLM